MTSKMTSQVITILAFTLVTLTIVSPFSASAKPFGLQVSPEEAHPNRKPIGVFTDGRISYSMGTYSSRLPIPLPPARNGLVPELPLEYRSDGNRTIYGVGWDLPLDHVRRSLRKGTPRYVGPEVDPRYAPWADEFEFRLGDHTGTLVLVRKEVGGLLLYRPKIEEAFAKFYYDPAQGYWIVQDRTGKTSFLGGYLGNSQFAEDRTCHPIYEGLSCSTFAWYVSVVIDSFGNEIKYSYESAYGNLYPTTIKYDLKESSTPQYAPQIDFTWEDIGHNNTPVDTTYRKGWRADLDGRLLKGITVRGRSETGAETIRNYTIQPGKTGNLHTLLSISPDALPAAEFSYNAPSPGLPVGRDIDVPGPDWPEARSLEYTTVSPGATENECLHTTTSMLADVDGDGALDQLFYKNGEFQWRRNTGWAFEPKLRIINVSACLGHGEGLRLFKTDLGAVNRVIQDVLDINGDHKADLVFSTSDGHIWVCLGDGGGAFGQPKRWSPDGQGIAFGYGLASTMRVPPGNAGKDEAGLLDVNGDGLPDYVRVGNREDDTLYAYINRGMDPVTQIPAGFESVPRKIWMGDFNMYGYHGPALRFWDDNDMIADLRDLNGDGLIDRVTTKLDIAFGRGPWMIGGKLFWGHKIDNNAKVVQTSVITNPANPVQTQYSGLYDVDGDGMLDIVGWYPNKGFTYRHFSGYTFESEKPLTVASGLMKGLGVTETKNVGTSYDRCNAVIMVRQTILDFDGDGRVEIVRGSSTPQVGGGALAWRAAIPGDGVQPVHFLNKSATGSAVTEITYGYPDQVKSKSSIRNWVVKQLVETDSATGEQRSQSIVTQDPFYDNIKREFQGHGKVQVSEAGGQRYQTYWYWTDDEFKYGREKRHDASDKSQTSDKPSRSVITDWDSFEELDSKAPNIRKWVRPKSVMTKINDISGGSQTKVEEYTYSNVELENLLGLVRSIRRRGAVSGPDDRITTYTYFVHDNVSGTPSNSDILLVKIASKTTTSGSGHQDASTSYKYDGMCCQPGQSCSPNLTKGALCDTVVDRGATEPAAETLTDYDDHGRLRSRTDPDGIKTTYSYHDQAGCLTPYVRTETNAVGHVVTYSNYHPFAGQARQICGPQKIGPSEKCDGFDYDLYGRLVNVNRGLYSLGVGAFVPFLVESYDYADSEQPPWVKYTRVPDPLAGPQGPALGFSPPQEKTTYFNRWGQVVMEVKPRGQDWSARSFEYDKLGRLQTGWLPYATNSLVYAKPPNPEIADRYVYNHDLLDRPTSSSHWPAGSIQAADSIIATYRGCITEIKDQVSNVTKYTNNPFDEITSISKQIGSQTLQSSFDYDSMGRVVRAQDEDGNHYLYTFYHDGHLKVATLPTGLNYLYLRKPSGRISSITSPNGDKVRFEYDAMGRPKTRMVEAMRKAVRRCADKDANRVDTFNYDEQSWNIGRLTSVESNHYRKKLDYDGIGNLTFKQFQAKGPGEIQPVLSIGFQYSPFGDPLRITYPSGCATRYHYAVSGNLDWMNDECDIFKVDVSYDPGDLPHIISGYLEGTAHMNFQRTNSYDSKRRLRHISSIIQPRGGTSWPWDIDYTYYPNNSVESISDSVRFPGTMYSYTYDEANRLWKANGYPAGPIVYAYNKNSSLDSVTTNGTVEQYTYDQGFWTSDVGEVLHFSHYEIDNITSPSSTIKLKRDESGNWCSLTRTSTDSLESKRTFSWYGDGKLASVEPVEQKPSFVVREKPPIVQYSYDENGKRWRTQRGTDDIIYIDDLLEWKNGKITEYVRFPDGRLELGPQKPYRVYFHDFMSTALVIDDGGKVVHSTSYYPYGKKILIHGVPDVPFDFNSKRREPKIGIIDYGTRHYDPEVRQWMAPDPLRLEGLSDVIERDNLLQPFVYAKANPTTFADSGNEPWEAADARNRRLLQLWVKQGVEWTQFDPRKDPTMRDWRLLGSFVQFGRVNEFWQSPLKREIVRYQGPRQIQSSVSVNFINEFQYMDEYHGPGPIGPIKNVGLAYPLNIEGEFVVFTQEGEQFTFKPVSPIGHGEGVVLESASYQVYDASGNLVTKEIMTPAGPFSQGVFDVPIGELFPNAFGEKED